MVFNHTHYQQRYRTSFQQSGQLLNDAATYGVQVAATPPAPGAARWQAIGVHHLTPDENRGQHNAFVDILDEHGQPLRDPNLRAGWSWEGRRPDEDAPPQPLDKGLAEPAGNVPLFRGALLEVWISDPNAASDHVTRLSTDHPDEPNPDGEIFNSIGHHSYYVVFQRVPATSGGGEDAGGNGDGGQDGGDELSLAATLLAEGELQQVIQFNPDAALQKRIFADGFVPNSPEFVLTIDGVNYICQRAEHLGTGEVRVYHVIVGDWGNVQHVSRPR
jgi:hypothetical protein